MHGNDASNSGSRFRLIVNNAIMTLKKTWIFNIQHVLNFIPIACAADDILCGELYKNRRKRVCSIKKNYSLDDRYLFMI